MIASELAAAPSVLNTLFHAQGSKSLSKRKREVETEEQVERDARQLRREMRMRGHVVSPHVDTVKVPQMGVQGSQTSV